MEYFVKATMISIPKKKATMIRYAWLPIAVQGLSQQKIL
jgi:hypothetical protein